MVKKHNTLLVLTGPTAVGKTRISIALAKRFNTAIISADSRQCYQGMPIGTAQPSLAELTEVKHYFINEFLVSEPQDAASFERLALGYLEEIFSTNSVAIVCGGTGLYIKALCEGLDEMPAVSEAMKATVEAGYKENGLDWLQEALAKEDPQFVGSAEWQNPARLMRALSFVRSNGNSIRSFQSGLKKERPFELIKFALNLPRELLYARINERVDLMMQSGLLEEAKAMFPYRQYPPLNTVGYVELFDFFDGKCSLNDAVEKIKQHSRNYAKRQLTWLLRDQSLHWIDTNTDAKAEICSLLEKNFPAFL
ncbi:MAG: tRNA (adenosine(37)-N6)-dimethylallyltransferase MiaA [Chitinophagaceae bacterium]